MVLRFITPPLQPALRQETHNPLHSYPILRELGGFLSPQSLPVFTNASVFPLTYSSSRDTTDRKGSQSEDQVTAGLGKGQGLGWAPKLQSNAHHKN